MLPPLRATATILLLFAALVPAPAQTALRVLSRGSGQGFVIVAGNDTLGYTTRGDYDEALLPPQLKALLSFWEERAAREPQPQTARPQLPSYKSQWTDVAPLIETHWHQGPPYNLLTPLADGQHCPAGCIATAGAQVAYYFRRDNPTELPYATPVYGEGETAVTLSLPAGTPLQWELMPLEGRGTAEEEQAVATLVYALATTAGLTFGSEATTGYDERMAYALSRQLRLLSSFRQKATFTQRAWEELIYANLTAGRPLLCSGLTPTGSGHTVVLDGYQASTGLYHFNFGWGGEGDGWYTVDDQTGIDGYASSQTLVCDLTPLRPHIEGWMESPTLRRDHEGSVTFSVSNGGTLPYSGFFIYVGADDGLTAPPAASDVSTRLSPGESCRLTLPLTPGIEGKAWVTLCGNNRQVIDKVCVDILPANEEAASEGIAAASCHRDDARHYSLSGQRIVSIRRPTVSIVCKGKKVKKVSSAPPPASSGR